MLSSPFCSIDVGTEGKWGWVSFLGYSFIGGGRVSCLLENMYGYGWREGIDREVCFVGQ